MKNNICTPDLWAGWAASVRKTTKKVRSPKKPQALRFFMLLFHFSLFTLHFSLNAQQTGWPLIRNYTPKEYGGNTQVFSVLQDKNTGIMYLGIAPGILTYDGARWAEIPTPNKSLARSLYQTDDGKIYVTATEDFGYLTADRQGKTIFRSLTHLIPDSTLKIGGVWSVKAAGKEVFFQTYQNIFRYLPEKNKIYVFDADTNGQFGGVFVHNENYYVRLSKKGLMKIENGQMKEAPNAAFFKDKNRFNESVAYDKNTLLIPGRTEGFQLYNPTSNAHPQPFTLQEQIFLADNPISCAYPLPKKRFVLGSLKQGAILIDAQGKTLQQFNEGNLLQNNSIYDINTDLNGNLWLGMPIGLSKTELGQNLVYWDKNVGLKGLVLALAHSQNGLYAATDQKLYNFDEQFRPQEVQAITVGQNWVLKEFLPPGDQTPILLDGTQTGIYQINGAQAVQIYKGDHATTMLQSKQNPDRLYSTDGRNFISLLYQNGQWVSEGLWIAINDDIRGITEEKDGTLWLGTYSNGIIKVIPNPATINKPKTIKYYTEAEGLPSLNNNSPFWFKGQTVWGTEKGLYAHNIKSDRFEPFCGLGKQFCDGRAGIMFFQEMPNGNIYISPSSNKKEDIGYLKPDGKGGYDWVYKPFRRLPEIAEIATMYAEENGALWIGGSEGLFRYDEKEDDKDYGTAFDCWVREVRAATDSVVFYGGGPINQNLSGLQNKFEYKNNSLKFIFAAPFFDNEEKTLYSYQLEGFDEHWSAWSRHTEKEYTALWEGDYVFKVKAKNIYDVESRTDSYAFTVARPYYRAWWAYSLYIVFAAVAVWGLVRYNTDRLVRQKIALERTVAERTMEISQKNTVLNMQKKELELQKEELEQQKEEILQQSEQLLSTLERVEIEMGKSDKLLLNILPRETADELKEKGRATTKHYETVTVLFTDFKGFTQIAENMHPEEVVENLNHCFTAFDRICKMHRVEKIKTIGDSYMCAAGIPTADDDNAIRMVEAAREMLVFMQSWKAEKAAMGVTVWDLRIGIHTGPVVAGVVGEDKFAYDIWGDTVNTASRMESSGEPSMINISEATYLLVKNRFECTYRGEMAAKNKGPMGMYFVSV